MEKKNEEFWSTVRGKAIIKLGIWAAFFLLFVIIIAITGGFSDSSTNNDEKENESVKFALYKDMLDEFEKKNYEFNYKITNGEVSIIYHGESDGISILGYREDTNGIIKYLINNGETYEVKVGSKEVINNLFDGLDMNIMDMNILINSLRSLDYVVQKEGEERVITYKNDEYELSVRTDEDNIKNININKDNIVYEMNFSNISKVEEIEITE